MKCPWCNAELKEGALYCDICGEEINMVPDFDPEIEDQCRETIETMTKNIFEQKSTDNPQKIVNKAPVQNRTSNSVSRGTQPSDPNIKSNIKNNIDNDKSTKGSKMPALLIFVFILVALVGGGIFIFVHVSSDSYKYKQAKKAVITKEYEKAHTLYGMLVDKDPYNVDLLVEYSEVLFISGNTQEYVTVLDRIADSSFATEAQRELAYEKLIYVYSSDEQYERIKELVLASEMPSLKEKYKDYLTIVPDILLAEGKYDLPQLLTLTSSDVIYYSLINYSDDAMETVIADSEIYKLPILLEMGRYKLSVYTVNKYGLKSETVEATYDIELVPPVQPEVSLPEGTYTSPQILEVFYDSDNVTVYYTTDGSQPTLTSKIYNESIVIPYGYTKYSFVSVDEYGLFSEVVSVAINMMYEYAVMPGTARDALTSYLLEKGTIISYDGTMPDGGSLSLVLRGFEPIGENYCYVFEEAILVDGAYSFLDVKYTVDMVTGEIEKMD